MRSSENEHELAIEEKINNALDSVEDILLDVVPYIAYMPAEYTSGLYSPSGKGIDDDEHLHAPSPEFLEFLVMNIVIPLLVSISANRVYEKWFAGEKLHPREELGKIRGEIIRNWKFKVNINVGMIKGEIVGEAKSTITQILTYHGVPEIEASQKAETINNKLLKDLLELPLDEV